METPSLPAAKLEKIKLPKQLTHVYSEKGRNSLACPVPQRPSGGRDSTG